jgi:hypothetical protein
MGGKLNGSAHFTQPQDQEVDFSLASGERNPCV